LQEKNTTISIAHRLSTIKRSEHIICIGADGRVAEQGPYKKLAANPNGAFNKLMEWQLNGGDAEPRRDPRPTESEEIERSLEEEDVDEDERSNRAGSGEPVTTPSTPTTRPK
jgi:putative ABC transport system ATP-binding protein